MVVLMSQYFNQKVDKNVLQPFLANHKNIIELNALPHTPCSAIEDIFLRFIAVAAPGVFPPVSNLWSGDRL